MLAQKLEDGPGRAADEELHPAGASSPTSRPSAGSTTAATTPAALKKAMDIDRLRRPAQGAGREAQARRADGHRHLELHRDRRRRAVEALRHPRASRCSTPARSASTPPARPSPASAPSRRARATRRPTRRSSPRSWASRPPTSRSRRATPTPRPTASAPTPAARRRRRARRARWRRARSATRRGRSPRTCSRSSEDDLEWEPGKFSVKGAPQKSKTIQEIAFAAYTNHPQGMEAGLEAVQLLRSAEPHLPLRQLHLRGRHRPRHGRGQDPPLRGDRRLRQHHQPDDRARARSTAGSPWAWRRRCCEEISYDESGNIQGGSFMDYLRADGDGDAEVGDRPHRDAVAAPSASAPRASASRPRSARRRRSPTRWWTRSRTSACATSTSRSRPRRCGAS